MRHVGLQGSEGQPVPVVVWTSTLQRTIQTAERLPFPKLRWNVLDEIQAGIFDGWTYAEIQQKRPEEFAARKRDKLSYRPALLALFNASSLPSKLATMAHVIASGFAEHDSQSWGLPAAPAI